MRIRLAAFAWIVALCAVRCQRPALAAAADVNNQLITRPVTVYDKQNVKRTITFIYGKAGDTWGWVVKDWLD